MIFTLDTSVAFVALIVSACTLAASVRFWRRSFRPIVTAVVKTKTAGNMAITYNLVLLNSGTIPAKNVSISADSASLEASLGSGADSASRERWLSCFEGRSHIPVLHNGDSVSCSFGLTRGPDDGFWRYKSTIDVVINYQGWFGIDYQQPQKLHIIDSGSFTGFMWTTCEG